MERCFGELDQTQWEKDEGPGQESASANTEEWTSKIDLLAQSLLHDDDFESEMFMDLPARHADQLKEMLLIREDYYTAVPSFPAASEKGPLMDFWSELREGVRT